MPPRRKKQPTRPVGIHIDALLAEHKKSLYRLSQESGIPYATLRRLRNEESESITFSTIAGICRALGCTPNDLFTVNPPDRKADGGAIRKVHPSKTPR